MMMGLDIEQLALPRSDYKLQGDVLSCVEQRS